MQAVVNRYNAYGNFGNYNVYAYYNAGIPTAQASYLGSIGFGGTYPNERVTMHEMAHYLGSGTNGDPWDGFFGEAQVDQFDGLEASLNGDSAHFWPYGLNFDSEFSEINAQRAVAMVYAQRADMGIGPTAHPSAVTTVTLTGSDPNGESGFNYKARWSDGYFPHANANYSTGPYILHTPESTNSFTFVGNSLTLSNPNVDTGLYYKGVGANGITTFNNLILNGGWIDHRGNNNPGDLFRFDGNLTVASNSNIRALNGNINILADVHGGGTLVIHPTSFPTENNRYVRFLSSDNDFTGPHHEQRPVRTRRRRELQVRHRRRRRQQRDYRHCREEYGAQRRLPVRRVGGRLRLWQLLATGDRRQHQPTGRPSTFLASSTTPASGATAASRSRRRPACSPWRRAAI